MRIVAIVALALLALPSDSRAQVIPNFTGSWRLSPGTVKQERVLEANERGSMSRPMGEIKITQSVGLVTLSGGHLTAVYRLGGTTTPVQARSANGTLVPATGRAHWEGSRLFLSYATGDVKREETTILSFDSNGNLHVEHTGASTDEPRVTAVFVRAAAIVP